MSVSNRKNTVAPLVLQKGPLDPSSARQRSLTKHHEMDFGKIYVAMEKGNKLFQLLGWQVCKLQVMKKWDPAYKLISLRQELRLLTMNKIEMSAVRNKPQVLDIRHIREVQTLEYKFSTIKINDKWKRDKDISQFDPTKILVISYGVGFTLQHWILLFESSETCKLWSQGVHNLMLDTRDRDSSCHTIRIERFLRKYFEELKSPATDLVPRKMMKPFVQTSLQYKVGSKQLQDATEDDMNLVQFSKAARNFIHLPELFTYFTTYSDDGQIVSFPNFLRFLETVQHDDMAMNRARAVEFLRRYLHQDNSFNHERIEPSLSVIEFCDFLFSRENSIWDPVNEKVIQDMTRPLSHYWIASSHNTYLTGDQLRSESSLDSYSQALLMGCRCIELDCWDGPKKPNSQECAEIVIYHGYTMTSKLALRDVLFTIKHYAFMTSEYPVILSIEDNCSVGAQRILAHDLKDILGEYLLITPVSKEETQLPSPAALKKKIIVKHKKLPVENENINSMTPLNTAQMNEFEDSDMMGKENIKKGVLHLKDESEWKTHLFVLFEDKLCYTVEPCSDDPNEKQNDDTVSMMGEEDRDEDSLLGFGVRPEEQHVTEEWFHGRCGRQDAVQRLLQYRDKGNGLFMIRDSNLFIGDFSLSILHDARVHHVRISTKMIDREKKYYFMENKMCDTLYELVSYYTRHYLPTPTFRMVLMTPCPQPTPHVGEPWYSATADKEKAEELLNKVNEDGAFLIRISTSDSGVFVLSLRVDGEIWHYRLKRDGRIFVVNQTVFENLNQIVEYYSNREFVRGISLRIPVNEQNVDLFASGEMAEQAPGCYMDLRDLDKEVQAIALRPYHGKSDDDLSFPANARITVLRKEEGLWKGRYGSSSGWFPSSYVHEVPNTEKTNSQESNNYNTIDLAGMLIEKYQDNDRKYVIRIAKSNAHWNNHQWIIAANSSEDCDDWLNHLTDLARSANDKLSHLRIKEKTARIAAELSNLVVYCQAVPFNPDNVKEGCFYEMCSFVETKIDKLMDKGLVTFNIRQISRVYPAGSRITSTNYHPVPMWNAACHMVALNYQTGDKPMQLNQGKFMGNGQCGYVLKPEYMIDENFDPYNGMKVVSSCPVKITINVIAGRHLARRDKNKGICSPFVQVELVGLPCDEKNYRSNTISSNGLNPVWNFPCSFEVSCPELALLRFTVEDGDFLGGGKSDPFIGQAVFPVDSLRCGYRSVPLKNQHSEELELSSLLVLIEIHTIENNVFIRNARTVLQASRLAPVHRKATASDSLIISPTAPRQMAPRLSSTDHRASLDSLPSSPSAPVLGKQSTFSSIGSQDSVDIPNGSSSANGSQKAAKTHKDRRSILGTFFKKSK